MTDIVQTAETPQCVRPPQVAGYFYPADATACARTVTELMAAAKRPDVGRPKVLIAPHAGYRFSGPIAASAYATLAGSAGTVERVVLLGPAHHVPFKGLSTTSADAWETPLGTVLIDMPMIQRLTGLDGFDICDKGFSNEHSLEVHLPFLQTVLPAFQLIPILVGDASPDMVSAALDLCWGGPETLIVISSDLSHYHADEVARKVDDDTARNVVLMRGDRLNGKVACGHRAIAGVLLQAQKRDLRVTALDLRNSSDTAGSPDRVVGYGAFAMEYAASTRLTAEDRQTLADTAFSALAKAAERGGPESDEQAPTPASTVSQALAASRATFVTLTLDGHLRGCVGSVAPHRSLIDDVRFNAVRAGFADRRFPPVGREDLHRLEMEISVLSHLRPIAFDDEAHLLRQLHPDADGLLIENGGNRALFLPSVWKSLPRAEDFLLHLKVKAGLGEDFDTVNLRAFRFGAERFICPNPFRQPAV